MLNIERYRKELENYNTSLDCDIHKIRENNEGIRNHLCISKTCPECRKENIEWLLSECQILDDAEKAYLSAVIKPFRNEVLGIKKKWAIDECIAIIIKNCQIIYLPLFKEGTMYQGMERDKRYTLEELGL